MLCALLPISAKIAGKAVLRCNLKYHHSLVSVAQLCSVFESRDHFSFMSETLRKRGREPEALADAIDVREPKRIHGEETERFLCLLQLDKALDDDEDEECAPNEELVKEVMKSLEEEIAPISSTYNPSSDSEYNSAASDISRSYERQNLDSDAKVDLCHLLEASDDDLGIPPSPALDLKDEVCVSTKETFEVLWENQDLKSLDENWLSEDDFVNHQQLALYEDAWDERQLQDYINRIFVDQDMYFYCDFSEA